MEEDQKKPAAPASLSPAPVKIIYSEPPTGAAQIYANYIDISWTSFDLQYRFSHNQRLANEETPTNKIEHRATVTLSWPQVKSLLLQTADVVKRYENLNGEIQPIPKLP